MFYFQVSMQNIKFMQTFQANDHLYKNSPYLVLLEKLFLLFMLDYFLVEISVIGVLHDYTEIRSILPQAFSL